MSRVTEYESGMRLAYYSMPSTKSVAIGVYVRCGSSNETPAENGISHFIEHMLFKGTARRSAFDIAEETEAMGVQINAFTSKDVTSYYTLGTGEHVELCMDVLSDLFFHAALDPKELEREKEVVVAEIKMGEDTPEDVCYERLSLALYGDTALGRTITGTAENVRGFTAADLRAYMAKHYLPCNTVISVAGGVSYERAEELVRTYFESQWEKGAKRERMETETLAYYSRVLNLTKPIEQANVALAFPAYPYGDGRGVALQLIGNVLGGGMSSRLFRKLREEMGLVYEIYTVPTDYAKNGHFSLYFATAPRNAAHAIDAVREVLSEAVREGLNEKELAKGKEQLKASVVLGAERSVGVMRAMGRSVVMDDFPFDVDARLSEIEGLTLGGVNAVMKEVLDLGKASLSYVGRSLRVDLLSRLQKGGKRRKNS